MMMMSMIKMMKINDEDVDCVNTVLILMLHAEGFLTGGDSAPQQVTPLATPAIYNNGNFICVFECTIVNLATFRQFTNAA